MSKHLLSDTLKTYTYSEKKKLGTRKCFSQNEISSNDKDVAVKVKKQKVNVGKKAIKVECDQTITNADQCIEKAESNNTNSVWYPNNWEKQLENIRVMRKNYTAPVDEMGCHKCADENATGPVFRFQSLIALMLSSQTKDTITYAAMQRLKENGCTPEYIISVADEELEQILYPVSFRKRKAQYLKSASKILLEKYNGDIPNNVQELCNLPGVGPKMAHICMHVAWKEVSGIGVDTHVHRISNRLKWVPKPTKTPEDTRIALESWLPKKLWMDINYLFVGFGQEICQGQRPKCSECLNNNICPYTNKKYQF